MRHLRNIVLDTNCLLQVLSRKSKNHIVWENFIEGKYNLCVTTDILQEYEEIIGQKMSPSVAQMLVEIILCAPNTYRLDAHYRWNLIHQDFDDNKFVDCAVVANADFIVTEDAHFKVLLNTPFPHVDIIHLDDFVGLLGSL